MKRYRVTLTDAERCELECMSKTNKTGAKRFVHARILLLCDSSPGMEPWGSARIGEALGVTPRCVENVKRRFVEQGLASALDRKEREAPPRKRVFDGEKEARLVALACSEAPAGCKRWTVNLLAEELVRLEIFESVSPSTVHRTLKKTSLSLI